MSNHLASIIAGILLLIMFSLAIFSIKEDSLTFDETAHITTGYSYLTQKDYRLNPEHPPLIKDIAALPLLFLNLNFPKDHPAWVQKEPPQWWSQFDLASQFLYHSGNNPDQILFWSRLPMIFLLIFLGWFLFKWARELFGNKAALLTLFFFSFSPTLLAHGRLVTTDVGAAAGIFIAIYYFIRFLKNPSPKNIIVAGISFGLAMLCKFTVALLIPLFGLVAFIWGLLQSEQQKIKLILKYLGLTLLVGIVGIIIIWPVYQYHVWNYPPEKQLRDTEFLLSNLGNRTIAETVIWMADKPVLRPYAHYALGLLMVMQRGAGGHTTYFLGEISAAGWKTYFPIVYLIKESLTLHILTLIALLYAAWLIRKPFWQNSFQRIKDWIKSHLPEFTMLVFIGIYWTASLSSNLNLGVRHLLPVFLFTFILVSAIITSWLKSPYLRIKYFLLGILILWQLISVISIYPHFLAYFNELAGGPNRGYIYTVNSNLDWGQDLKRLKKWVNENKIDKIYVDYFGGGDLKYYLKEKYEPWWGTRDPKELPKGNYLAVSASLLQGGRGEPARGFDQPTGYYHWLDKYTPVTKIGYSIFVYYIP